METAGLDAEPAGEDGLTEEAIAGQPCSLVCGRNIDLAKPIT